MRPLDRIPDEFLNVRDDLGEPLPLLEEWLDRFVPTAPLAGSTLLLVQHQLSNHAAQAEALVRLGADPARLHWLDIPYTSHQMLRDYAHTKLGIPRDNLWTCDDYRVLDPYAAYQHQRAVRLVLQLSAADDGPLIVLDDGAYAVEALAALHPARWPRRVAVVEQTTRGLIKLRGSRALQAVVARLPFINVAESTPKRTLEPPFIAMSVCGSLHAKIEPLRARPRRCLVLGYGAIGEQVATYFARHFRVQRRDVFVEDPDQKREALAASRGFSVWDGGDVTRRFDVVVGCSGTASFTLGDHVFLADGALLASASSGAVELSRADFIELAEASPDDDIRIATEKITQSNLHSDVEFALVDRTATFLNAGFPINFDGRLTTTPGRYIQPTPVMMCAATVQARQALDDRRAGVLDLSRDLCAWIEPAFRAILGPDEAQMLDPPPETAW